MQFFSFTDGRQERVMFDKITSRIQKLCYGLNADFVDPVCIHILIDFTHELTSSCLTLFFFFNNSENVRKN